MTGGQKNAAIKRLYYFYFIMVAQLFYRCKIHTGKTFTMPVNNTLYEHLTKIVQDIIIIFHTTTYQDSLRDL